ncbi:ABC transporter permease [Promicromonospora thailandica]|uniref:Peptide/nickel transport system permease protein n=1 Tax=Promicromonospora thailandica TaxID=765201 RepID=A0A9X2G0G7_9MICO|nr:ABC transporter permease [Promicromonospora thailandica]MCP2263735.1 peptide/nickel transport system permease protein [Promicromonospora thailandica]BFF17981.1 ABC transporter permease [Promicromonospora thailandica]
MTTPTAPAAALPDRVPALAHHRWVRFAVRRSGRLLVSLWVLVTAAFGMIHLVPGDPVRASLGPTASAELVAARRESLGLDQPLWEQYLTYLRHLLTGDLGTSFGSHLPVADTIAQRLPATAGLALLAFLTAVLVAVPVGVAVAVATRRGRAPRTELGFASTSVLLATIPDFLLAVALVWVFGVTLGWLPIAGQDGAGSFVLPVLALAVGPAAILARIVRVEMLAVLETDYVRTARAKRLPPVVVHLGHALPNAVTASLTLGGLLLGQLVAGTVLVESVFAWPGLGSTIVSSILAKDYPLVQGTVLVYGVGVLLVNTLVDVALAVLDPRSAIGES